MGFLGTIMKYHSMSFDRCFNVRNDNNYSVNLETFVKETPCDIFLFAVPKKCFCRCFPWTLSAAYPSLEVLRRMSSDALLVEKTEN